MNVDDSSYKYITEKLKWSAVSQMNANIIIFDVLNQFVLTKLSNESKTNYWKLHKASAEINRQLAVLSVHVLNVFNAHMSETDIKELFNADWMLMKLKEEIKLTFMIKWTFIQIIKNQNVRN